MCSDSRWIIADQLCATSEAPHETQPVAFLGALANEDYFLRASTGLEDLDDRTFARSVGNAVTQILDAQL